MMKQLVRTSNTIDDPRKSFTINVLILALKTHKSYQIKNYFNFICKRRNIINSQKYINLKFSLVLIFNNLLFMKILYILK